ncbi:phage tail protein [Bacillus sp. AFS018417]|uniref:phage tail domain-containing protein n=1 Tax=Bacillus sp. AFS018417 TaxID=2033491 RepID=UPI000BF59C36|nr:phage tail domain-containing protein [Bacillus sp. AFS018417]PEZ05566.1 phage tail protein [Bacillus sp. AFS018417]
MITLDDKYRFEDFGFEYEPGNKDPLTPVFDRKTMFIPGRVGSYKFGAEIKEKHFTFPLKIMERFYDVMQQKFNELTAFLFDPYGNPRKFKMVLDYEPDKFYYVELAQQIIPDRITDEADVVLVLVADDPRKYSLVTNDEVTWGSETITFENTIYTFGHTGGGQVEKITSPRLYSVFVSGMVQTPIIKINGTGTNVIVSANGKSFSLGTFNNTDWIIDGNTWTVLKNGANGLSDYNKGYPNGSWLEFMPGDNQISINGTSLDLTIQIEFRDKFI